MLGLLQCYPILRKSVHNFDENHINRVTHLLTALSKYRRIVSNKTNVSFSLQSQLAQLYSEIDFMASDSVDVSSVWLLDGFGSCTKDTRLIFGSIFAVSNKVFFTGAFIPSEGFNEATAHECSCDGKNKCKSIGSLRIKPATLNKKTISSSSYGEALPAALLQ